MNNSKEQDQENPLNPVKRDAELHGKRIVLSQLINACRLVGSPHVTVEALQKELEDLA